MPPPRNKRKSTAKSQRFRKRPLKLRSFPFERLPVELQANVLRLALPHRLAPSLVQRAHNIIKKRRSWSTNLLRVNKAVSNLTRSILTNEIPLVFKVAVASLEEPLGLTVLDRDITYSDQAARPQMLADMHQIHSMRRFELDLMSADDCSWWSAYKDQPIAGIHAPFDCAQRESEYKEKLRFICDTLVAFSDNIQHLSVRVPCTCQLKNDEELALTVVTRMVDYLAPLRRLHVAKSVTFHVVHNDHDQPYLSGVPLNVPRAEQQCQILQASLGRLRGEKLSEHEEMWKNLKSMDWPTCSFVQDHFQSEFRSIREALDGIGNDFEKRAEQARVYISNKLRQEKSLALEQDYHERKAMEA
ncbi:MAG: hypothetical protein Q9220_000126 [cf. Caloplaca sp. 1 TL-2023]